MSHVWHAFAPLLHDANAALKRVGEWLAAWAVPAATRPERIVVDAPSPPDAASAANRQPTE